MKAFHGHSRMKVRFLKNSARFVKAACIKAKLKVTWAPRPPCSGAPGQLKLWVITIVVIKNGYFNPVYSIVSYEDNEKDNGIGNF